MDERREKTVRRLNSKQAAFLQSMPKGATIEHRRSATAGASVGESPDRSSAGRGTRISK